MGCEFIKGRGPKGEPTTLIICSRGQRQKRCQVTGCTRPSTKLCDFALTGAKTGKTCDRAICDAHAHRQGEIDRIETSGFASKDTVDFCPTHAELAKAGVEHG